MTEDVGCARHAAGLRIAVRPTTGESRDEEDSMDAAENERLYRAALDADEAWSRELRRIFGRRAGDARYTSEGRSTPVLTQLHDAWAAANAAYMKTFGVTHL